MISLDKEQLRIELEAAGEKHQLLVFEEEAGDAAVI